MDAIEGSTRMGRVVMLMSRCACSNEVICELCGPATLITTGDSKLSAPQRTPGAQLLM